MKETRILTYESYLTGNANPTAELPTIVLLHYMGINPIQVFELLLSNFDYPLRVIAPYGQFRHEEQPSWFPDSLYNESERDQGRFIDEIVEILLENEESWRQKFPIQGKLIYLGVSQGGDICFTLAAKYGDHFRLCMPIAGRLLTEETIRKNNSGIVRIHHGEKDPIVPITRAREAEKQLLLAGINVALREHMDVGHVAPEMCRGIFNDIYATIQK